MSEEKEINGTFIDGIAASEHLDSSGERIRVEGIDISSLTKDGVLNMEHQSKEASAIVGKILKAKKILKESDCETDRHRYFWNKIKIPYLYIMGELFDADGHQAAKDIAAMLKYDKRKKHEDKETKKLINFSIEGSRLEKKGAEILKSIARKVSVTITPCNKVCEAELLLPDQIVNNGKLKKFGQHEQNFSMIQDLMSKKEEHFASCEPMEKANWGEMGINATIKNELPKPSITNEVGDISKPNKGYGAIKDATPKPLKPNYGKVIVKSKKKKEKKKPEKPMEKREFFRRVGNRWNQMKQRRAIDQTARKMQNERESQGIAFDPDQTAMASPNKTTLRAGKRPAPPTQIERDSIFAKPSTPLGQFSPKYAKDSKESSDQKEKRIGAIDQAVTRQTNTLNDMRDRKRAMISGSANADTVAIDGNPSVKKALTAGSAVGAPSTLTGGAALGKMATSMVNESVVTPSKAGSFTKEEKKKKKKKALKEMSDEAFNNFEKKEELLDFLVDKLPNNSAEEIMALAKTVAFTSIKKKELMLADLMKASKNVREQRKKVFGSKSQPGKGSKMRDKHMETIGMFADRFLGLQLNPSGGKIDEETGGRRSDKPKVGVDKPDWRSGQLETQWNPEAAVHEMAHLMLLPQGIGLEDGQRLMDQQYKDVQRDYGYMKQKESRHEVQPMAAEQIIRRMMGLPASQVAKQVKPDDPERVAVEDGKTPIAQRVQRGKTRQGDAKYVDLLRLSQNLTPENRKTLTRRLSGQEVFHPEKGWHNAETSDAKINTRAEEEKMDKAEVKVEEMQIDLMKDKKKKKKPFKGYNSKKHAKTGGMSDKAREKYNRENNADLKRPVTSDNPKGKAKKRKKSFCARMKGNKGPTSKDGELTPKGAALKRWNC